MAEALSLREVTDLVFYDVPASKVARFYCHWLVCESVCLWTSSVNVATSTFETRPLVHYLT